MLTATVMSDAVSRHIVPAVYPPIESAAEQYVLAFLRLIGADADAPSAAASATPAPSSTASR
jgi:hypothetical protein